MLNEAKTLCGTLSGAMTVRGILSVPRGQSSLEVYDGDYEVNSFVADPSFTTSRVLGTKTKYMKDNVTIYSVPTKELQNEAGGVTFVIGD